MELCEGGESFDRIVQSGHFNKRAASKITKTIIEVIKVCHDNGVIHRDLKPENFLFANASESSPLKAIDFGLSTFFEPGQHFREIVGSPYYMAPGALQRDYGSEVDVWSAGVILYILLCGVPPFWAGKSEFQVSLEDQLIIKEVLGHTWIQNTEKASNIPLGENVRLRIKQFSLMNKFKEVLGVVADNLPDDQVDSIREMFDTMDTDKNGALTCEELKHGFCSYGQLVQDQDVQMFMEAECLFSDFPRNCRESPRSILTSICSFYLLN
ncbi:hypothetical protein MLD38_038459 [Melastoma candidum]|uniref:Uncharacterized protein n=1 Tax=Melastoma candidum TaxID=119954 RepID=A0ACB9KZK1_9MYRT|nr:hypothetical protein MLD38_038459 [Melastoma candidum]